ncbi:hypothetical protein ES705_15562 [subsurface metagenome]
MATLILQKTSGGSIRRCDSRCHYAKFPECKCICGGRFHGAGKSPGGIQRAWEKHQEEALRKLSLLLSETEYLKPGNPEAPKRAIIGRVERG